jgi:Zn-dependent peptidase ImmA (M78 family)/DNA-binding XRE family transcriptional regulator
MSDFTRQRLTLARKRIGLTIAALARETELSTRILSAYENGSAEPSAATVRLLAEQLQVSQSFFGLPEIDEVPVEAVSFRALSKMTARQRDAALNTGAQIVEFDNWLSARFKFPAPDLPTLPGYEPETAAATVRAKWGLGEQPIKNVVHLLEAHGARVYSLRDDLKDLDAFSFFAEASPFVLMSARKSGERSRFDAAHELGHLVLHCEHERPGGPQAEAEANRFAAALLMPAGPVKAAGLRNATLPMVLRWKQVWGVAAMALTHRLQELDLLTEWGYRDLCVQLSKAGFRRSEPGGIPREKSERLRQAIGLLREEHVSVAEVASTLSIDPAELKSWMLGITMQAL